MLDKRIVLKIKLCIIYLKYRFVSDGKISRVVAVPTVKKNGKIKENVHEKHTLQRDVFLKTVYRVSVRVHCYIFSAIYFLYHHSMQLLWNVIYLFKYYLYEISLHFWVVCAISRHNNSRSNGPRFMHKLSKSV